MLLRLLRAILMVALAFLSATALWGGSVLIAHAHGSPWGMMPQSLLEYSPFGSYLIPGIVLFAANGLLAAWVLWLAALRKLRYGLWIALQGCVLLGWLMAECLMLRIVTWLHGVYAAVALLFIAAGIALRHEGERRALAADAVKLAGRQNGGLIR